MTGITNTYHAIPTGWDQEMVEMVGNFKKPNHCVRCLFLTIAAQTNPRIEDRDDPG
jgi:hypothetical protein